MTQNEPRLLVIDSRAEYNNGFTIVYDFENLYEYIVNKDNFKVACRFTNDDDIEFTFKLIFVLKNICLLAEEAEVYISPYAKQSYFLNLVRYGRHQNISIVGVARRASELSIDLRANTDIIYSFKQTEQNDLEKMEKIGFQNLDNLPEHEYKQIIL